MHLTGCNGAHQCVGGGTTGGWGATCTGNGDCMGGLFCGLFSGICQEACETETTDCATDGCCQLSGQPCCVNAFVNICSSC